MKKDEAEALFKLAGFTVTRIWELANMYWGGSEAIARNDGGRSPTGPWWLLMTEIGPVRVGWRKRVLEIEWDACAVRGIVTDDDGVSKAETYVHAWSLPKAVEYLQALRALALNPPAIVIDGECMQDCDALGVPCPKRATPDQGVAQDTRTPSDDRSEDT